MSAQGKSSKRPRSTWVKSLRHNRPAQHRYTPAPSCSKAARMAKRFWKRRRTSPSRLGRFARSDGSPRSLQNSPRSPSNAENTALQWVTRTVHMTKWKYSLHTIMLLIASATACFGQKSYTLTPINSGGQTLSMDWISDDASTAFGWEIQSNPFAGPCVIYQNGAATAIPTPGFRICQPEGANNNGTYLLGYLFTV